MPILTLKQAKMHVTLPLDVTLDDKELQLILDAAHSLVLDNVKQRRDVDDGATWALEVDAWDANTAPAHVKIAINTLFGFLARHRGDDDVPVRLELGELPHEVTSLIWRLRDPAIA